MKLTLDFETRSTVDLLTSGPWKYAAHPSTDILCLAIKADSDKSVIWAPDWVQKLIPVKLLRDAFMDGGLGLTVSREINLLTRQAETTEAHNVEFERAIWHHIMHLRYGFCDLELDKCDCTAARAAVHSLPRKLETVSKVLGVSEQKDMAGHRLMLKMCKPRKPRKAERLDNPNWENTIYWHEKPEDFISLFGYCAQDVETEYAVSQVLRPLSKKEREVWKLDQVINQRGVQIDIQNVESIIETLTKHQETLLLQMIKITNGAVTSPRKIAKLQVWLAGKGVVVENLQKATVEELMGGDLPDDVRQVLYIRMALAKASTAKFKAMLDRDAGDGRARSLFMYHGAGTGRASAKAIQPQNMPRDCYEGEELEDAYAAFRSGDIDYLQLFFDDPFQTASKCIRGACISAPGKRLIAADYSSIEARGNAWAAGEEKVLQSFRNNLDLYKVAAADLFGKHYDDITKAERQVGKVEVLFFGYQGGIGAFSSAAVGYGIDLEALPGIVAPRATRKELDGPYGARALAASYVTRNPDSMSINAAIACDIIKRKWRADNPAIAASWKEYHNAAFGAVSEPGNVFTFRKAAYRTWVDPIGNKYLLCQLPSGRMLFYFDPQIRDVLASWGEKTTAVTCKVVDAKTKQWSRRPIYAGLLCENFIQAICRDIMTEAQLRVEKAGYSIVLHVHDELIAEVENGHGSLNEFESIMGELPSWAGGFPIVAKGWEGNRFRK